MRTHETPSSVRERFDEYLRVNNKRRTAERMAILDCVLKMPGHFSAESLGVILRNEDFPVSIATIYSTLELLVDFGLLVRQRFADKACLYEKLASTSSVHHHLICTLCGKIKEVKDPSFSKYINERHFPGFIQNYYSLNIYGTCSACSRKKNKTVKKNP